MIDLMFLRRKLGGGMYRALPLKQFPWVATTSYIVNRASKQKLLDLLSDLKALDVAYDLQLKYLIDEGALSAFFLFPFAMTLSPSGGRSDHGRDGRKSP